MIGPLLSILARKRIVLASSSPRRRNILESVGLVFQVMPSTFSENLDKSHFATPHDYARENARLKAVEVSSRLKSDGITADLVIGVDTIVVLDGSILEKPKSEDAAKLMLKQLSGRTHTVVSGVTLIAKTESTTTFTETTEVTFASLTDSLVDYYVETGEPMDKAGAYGIQGIGGSFVTGIVGDYYNVVGLPLQHVCREIVNMWETGHLV